MVYSVSDDFLQAILRSGKRKTVVDVYVGNSSVPVLTDLPIVSGQITVDRSSKVRRSGQVTVGDPTLIRQLEPNGIEVVVRTGIVFPQSEELVPLGVFAVDRISYSILGGNLPTLEIYDRSHTVSEQAIFGFVGDDPFAGERAELFINNCVMRCGNDRWSIDFDEDLDNPRLPGGTANRDTDRWDAAAKAADVMHAEIFFDTDGICRVVPPPELDIEVTVEDAVYTVAYGSNLVDVDRTSSRENFYNGVIVHGAGPNSRNANKPVYAQVVDSKASSPTRWGGPRGKKTYVHKNSAITTNASAARVASKWLTRGLSLTRTITIECLANPALEEGDIIALVEEDGTETVCLIEAFTFDFNYSNFSLTVRTLNV